MRVLVRPSRQIMSYAIRHDLYVESNPVVEVDRIPRQIAKPQALDTASLEASGRR